MAALKRPLDDPSTSRKPKKSKTADLPSGNSPNFTSKLVADDVDFPRGGGTTFTPLEVKAIRAEAVKEANAELFKDSQVEAETKQSKKRKRKSDVATSVPSMAEKGDRVRIEHLNYKRLNIGMKILGQIVSVEPLALIVSLPNQLFGHVPITNISSQFTALLERMDENEEEMSDEDEDESGPSSSRVPDLFEMFHQGQYVRAVVTTVHAPGSTDTSGIGKSRHELAKASRRVELSLLPERVNSGVKKTDFKAGFTLSAAVKSVEDHGYILDLGISDISGFLSFKDAKKGPFDSKGKLHVGRLLDVTVSSISANGRTCNLVADFETFRDSCLSEAINASSVLPGTAVQALITAVHPTGLNLQVLGFFDATVDQFHLRPDASEKTYKVGKKVKARVLYDYSTTPPRFALTLADHVLRLRVQTPKTKNSASPSIQEAYPVGTILDSVTVLRLEAERGAVVEIDSGAIQGFIHISHVSDDHVPSLSSSGPWKPGSLHKARVTGYFPFDGLLQLSMKASVLEQKFLQVSDVQVGEVIKGTIKKLTDSGLFVSMSGNVDGVVWPTHYADITLKHPAKRFKLGASIKCRVLVVDPDRKRISLTAKKSIIESSLPVIAALEDATVGTVAHAVVFKVFEKHVMVEFYNNIKAVVPAREISETPVSKLTELFPIGKVLKVRIINLEDQGRIIASVRQASSNFDVTNDISAVEIGNVVQGTVAEIHADNAVLTLRPSQVRALISLNNVANHRKLTVSQLRAQLKIGENLDDLLVVTRNVEKGFVIVACKPKAKSAAAAHNKASLSIDTVAIGDLVGGRILRHIRQGALVKLPSRVSGTLHPTDTADDYDLAIPFPQVDSVLKACVIAIDKDKKQLTLSTRHSRMYPDEGKPVVDPEIKSLEDLYVGATVRGFIKGVVDHGLFVNIGRDIAARVQIKELFDDFVKEWKERFSVNQLVKGRILSVDMETKKVEMTLRSGDLTKASAASLAIADLVEGQKVDGVVTRIEDYGLFIQISGSKLNGLCHKSQLSDNPSADVAAAVRGFREGDRVKAYIMKIDKRKISFSLKPSYFTDEDFDEANPTAENSASEESNDEEDLPGNQVDATGSDDEDDADEDIDAMQIDIDPQQHMNRSFQQTTRPTGPSNVPSLQLSGGFQWSTNMDFDADGDQSEASDSDDSGDEKAGKKKKRRRKQIEQDLTADMHTKSPESNADFERLLLGSPNSSYLWIQYMSFQLQLSEVDKARDIARRALQTINFREEQEKLNVWIALLNLENSYGTDETVETTFKEAAKANDPKTIHLRLALIFDQSDKPIKAEEQYQRTCKKFGQSSKVWTHFSEFFLRQGNVEESRKLLPRCLQSLDKRKHLKTISRFAQLEYKLGDPERGKTLFEGIVDSHPKRLDLWSIYMDMEASQGQIQSLRNLFDRVLAQKMTSHKAKAFFKKWLELEKRIGDEDGMALCKAKAVEWTQRAS